MVIAALGVLNDITVTQIASVAELRNADPSLGPVALYRAGLRIGRDHIASTVNTLALAFAGASLPLLILFALSRQSLGTVANSESVAVEIVSILRGQHRPGRRRSDLHLARRADRHQQVSTRTASRSPAREINAVAVHPYIAPEHHASVLLNQFGQETPPRDGRSPKIMDFGHNDTVRTQCRPGPVTPGTTDQPHRRNNPTAGIAALVAIVVAAGALVFLVVGPTPHSGNRVMLLLTRHSTATTFPADDAGSTTATPTTAVPTPTATVATRRRTGRRQTTPKIPRRALNTPGCVTTRPGAEASSGRSHPRTARAGLQPHSDRQQGDLHRYR